MKLSRKIALLLTLVMLVCAISLPAMAEDVTIRVALWDYSNTEYYKTMINGFKEANPGIDVEVIEFSAAEYSDTIVVKMAAEEDYDVIFLGYPIWFGTYAPPVSTVLASVDFSGKKVVPFCTFGSGGLDSSVKDLQEKLPDAEILPGYGVRAARIDAVPAEIDRFLKAGGFIKGESVALPDFSIPCPVTEEEAAIFDAAVGDYPMMHAKAEEVASRAVPGGVEYLFTARDLPREMPKDMPAGAVPEPRTMKVYVLAEEGQAPVFTQVVR